MQEQNGPTTVESSLVISYEVKSILTLDPSNRTHRYIPKRNKSICLQKYLYRVFMEALFVKGPKMETTQISKTGKF